MNQQIKWVLVVLVLPLLLLAGCQEDDQKYASGKDTRESYGDGRFSILNYNTPDVLPIADGVVYSSKEDEERIKEMERVSSKINKDNEFYDFYNLYDIEKQETIEPVVFKYSSKGDFVYTVGSKGYTILNYRTGKFKQSNDLNKFTFEEQAKILLQLREK